MKKQKSQTEDFVNTFQLLETKLRKRLLYTPNYREVEQQYHSLLKDIRGYEREHHQGGRTEGRLRYYSAFCSLSLAKCQRALKNTNGEACSLLSAGRQYMDEHFDTEERGVPNMEESYNIALQCFQLTCDIYLAAGKRQLAACVYIELATLLQAMGRTQEGSCFFLQASGIQQEYSSLNAIESLLARISCCLTHRDYRECTDAFEQIIKLSFLALSPHRVADTPSAPITLSSYTNHIISSRIGLLLMKTLQRDFLGEDVGGVQNLFVQLAETGGLSYGHGFVLEPEEAVMLLQDFVKGCQLRNLEFVRSTLPSLSSFTTPLQWRIVQMIVDDLALDEN